MTKTREKGQGKLLAAYLDAQELEDIYDRWYSSPAAAHWEDAPGKAVVLSALRCLCDAEHPLRLLDVACGTGTFLERIRSEVSRHWELHGIDISGVAIDEGRRRLEDLHLVQGDATAPDFPAASLDIVTCYGSWEHFPDPAAAIGEASKLLVPGGRVLAMIPALGIHRTDRNDEGWYEDAEVPGTEVRQQQWNLQRATWARMFEDAGLHLFEESLARRCGAHKPGVFFFAVKTGATGAEDRPGRTSSAFRELGRLAFRMSRDLCGEIDAGASVLADCLRQGGKILVCGNGGSAADAQHFVAELVGRLKNERRSLPALSLCVDPSVMTALSNDYGYRCVFARQVEGLGQSGDVLLGISTSGRSPNVLEALDAARERGLRTIALLGCRPLPALSESDLCIQVPHDDGQRVQEAHTAVLHALCTELEMKLEEGD